MFADPEWFTCIKDTISRTKMQETRALFLHTVRAEGSAFLPGTAPEGSLPGGDPSSTLPLIFTLQMPQEPLQLQSKQCRKAVRFHPPRATVPTVLMINPSILFIIVYMASVFYKIYPTCQNLICTACYSILHYKSHICK